MLKHENQHLKRVWNIKSTWRDVETWNQHVRELET